MHHRDHESSTRPDPPRLTTASPLEIRHGAAGTHVSLARLPLLQFVALSQDIVENTAGHVADNLDYDAAATSNPWTADSPQLTALADPQQGLYLSGERHLAWFHAGSGQFIPTPGVQWHLGVATETIAAGGSGHVEVWLVDSGSAHADSTRRVTAYDWLGNGAAIGDHVVVAQHLQSRRWYFLGVSASSPASPFNQGYLFEVRLGTGATAVSISGTSPVAIPFDEISLKHGEIFALGTSSPGEVTVNAAGIAELYHHDAAKASSTPTGDNLTHWWIERKPAAAGGFAIIGDTLSRMHHPNFYDGQETKLLKHLVDVAYGDTFRVQASRAAGGDTLLTDTLAGGGPTNFLGIFFLSLPDAQDYAPALSSISGTPYDPSTGTGDQTLKLGAYYRLEETGSTADRADFSGNARTLRVLELGTASIPGVTGHVGTAASIAGVSEWLNRGAFGNPNPESVFLPASQIVSIACWINLNNLSYAGSGANLVGLGGVGAWRVMVDASGSLTAITGQTGGMGHPDAAATVAAVPTGIPLMLTASFNGFSGQARVRVQAADRSYDQSATATVSTPSSWFATPSVWHLDVGSTITSAWIGFTIEQLGIWFDAALTPAEQNFLFAAGAGRRLM